MTEKELHKLNRHDMLKLMLAQGKEAATLSEDLEAASTELAEVKATNERLKLKLDEKDALIEKLKNRLDQKDARIKDMILEMEKWRSEMWVNLQKAGTIAESAMKLSGVFESAYHAVDMYLDKSLRHADFYESSYEDVSDNITQEDTENYDA